MPFYRPAAHTIALMMFLISTLYLWQPISVFSQMVSNDAGQEPAIAIDDRSGSAIHPQKSNTSLQTPKSTMNRQVLPGAPKILSNLTYNADGQKLDLCLPASTLSESILKGAPMPAAQKKAMKQTALVFIHGGSFTSGDKAQMASYCKLFASAGFVSASINYSLSPAHPFPSAVNDVGDATRWLQEKSKTYRFDPKRVVLIGYSAGGNLALMSALQAINAEQPSKALSKTALSFRKLPTPPPVAGIVSIAGVYDLNGIVSTSWLPNLAHDLESYMVGANADTASPLNSIKKGLPPVMLIHGESDNLVPPSQAQRLFAEMKAKEVPSILRTYPKVGHEIFLPNPQLGRVLQEMTQYLLYIEAKGEIKPKNDVMSLMKAKKATIPAK